MAKLDYRSSGVDREAADKLVGKIAGLARATLDRRVRSSIGGYASLYEISRDQWLAASTDGVGTKLKLAFATGKHDTIGIDLVAMSVNDLICVGARPLFFLDYFATGKLKPQVALQVLKGITRGCRESGCALVGGETAEMPSMYAPGEYDLAGFAVGMVHPRDALPTRAVRPGDVILGLPSSGFHSNGYSLVRKWLDQERGARRRKLERDCLVPTRLYVRAVQGLIEQRLVKGLAHITGSGLLNLPRISDRVSYELVFPRLRERAAVFGWAASHGLPAPELYQTFNMGVGLMMVVDSKNVEKVVKSLKRSGEPQVWRLGQVVRSRGPCTIDVRCPDLGSFSLRY